MKILLAEDENDLREVITDYLEYQGHTVTAVPNGKEALERAGSDAFDAMVMDVMMPVMDGITALEILRMEGNTTPILMLTAKSELEDRVHGLDAGADDYLAKPYQMAELLARLRSLTRRSTEYRPKDLHIGKVTLNVEEQELSCENSIRLSKKEARLMEYLMVNPDREFTLTELKNHVWSEEESEDQVVWIYISYLRSKLEAVDADLTILGEKGGPFRLTTAE